MRLQFGVFDHIEPVPGLRLDQIYRQRLLQTERLDTAGFHAYHLAEHHTPAIHSLAPSQNVFLGAVAQRTTRLRFGPCVYGLPASPAPPDRSSFQWGDLTHEHAMRSIELFATEVMPHYLTVSPAAPA